MNKRRIIETEYYKYNNPNPRGKIAADCVIRALTLASERLYVDVYNDLFCESLKSGYIVNEKKCYEKWLQNNGWVKMGEPRNYDNTKMTVKEFIRLYYGDTIKNRFYDDTHIIAYVGSHHIVAIINGVVNDIWNSSMETMHTYWIKPR